MSDYQLNQAVVLLKDIRGQQGQYLAQTGDVGVVTFLEVENNPVDDWVCGIKVPGTQQVIGVKSDEIRPATEGETSQYSAIEHRARLYALELWRALDRLINATEEIILPQDNEANKAILNAHEIYRQIRDGD